ncbi:MAG: hypothetical protein ACI8R4_003241 [Paracoccaceae bacterium]|jgi:hypothetical protein
MKWGEGEKEDFMPPAGIFVARKRLGVLFAGLAD